MANYIRIRNESKPVDRRYFEKLGAGNKREDDKTIGQFGSGACYAPMAALRLGMEYVVCGFDNDGTYQLKYVAESVNGINEIFYDYDGFRKPSSFTLEAGMLGWGSDWQIFREAMSNAIDEYYEYGAVYSVESVDKISAPVDGEVSVYITATPGMRKIIKDIDKYFALDIVPLDTYNGLQVFSPTTKTFAVYLKGVLVHERENDALFSYNYSGRNLELNEERTVKYSYVLNSDVSQALLCTESVEVATTLIKSMNDDKLIENKLNDFGWGWENKLNPDVWTEAWDRIYPNGKTVPVSSELFRGEIRQQLKLSGYTAVICESKLVATALRKAGVITLNDVLGADIDYKTTLLSEYQQSVLDEAERIVTYYEPDLANFRVEAFTPTSNQHSLMGAALPKERMIMIADRTIDQGLHQTVATLLHECDHLISELPDNTREFRDEADNRLASIMIENYKPQLSFKFINDNYMTVPVELLKDSNMEFDALVTSQHLVLSFGTKLVKLPIEVYAAFKGGEIEVVDKRLCIKMPKCSVTEGYVTGTVI